MSWPYAPETTVSVFPASTHTSERHKAENDLAEYTAFVNKPDSKTAVDRIVTVISHYEDLSFGDKSALEITGKNACHTSVFVRHFIINIFFIKKIAFRKVLGTADVDLHFEIHFSVFVVIVKIFNFIVLSAGCDHSLDKRFI